MRKHPRECRTKSRRPYPSTRRIETGKVIDRAELIDAVRKLNADCVPHATTHYLPAHRSS
jgi:hypothetical protein